MTKTKKGPFFMKHHVVVCVKRYAHSYMAYGVKFVNG